MSERELIERLSEAVDALLAGRELRAEEPELAMLLVIAADLRDLPDPRFEKRLREELFPGASVIGVRPYLLVEDADRFFAFVEQTFDAEVIVRVPAPGGKVLHAEVRIGDSHVELSDAAPQSPRIVPPMHVYVDDADAAYTRAIAAGATSLYPPVDQPYGDREAGVRDPLGNEWFIATHLEGGPRPPGFGMATPGVRVSGARAFLDFLQRAFNATVAGEPAHAEVRLGHSLIEVGEAHGQWGPVAGAFHLFVRDCDTFYEQALRAGATSVTPPENKPYGERMAAVADPFGNQWYIGERR